MSGTAAYDVFLSLAGPDRPVVRALYDALTKEGLRVFLDETSIDYFDPITPEIEDALRSSTALLAYYSRHFPSRLACQQETTAAFLAGQREGDPMRRILVVNPEDPSVDHLVPGELRDARYITVGPDGMKTVARQVRRRIRELDGRIGDARVTYRRRWYGRMAGSIGFVGRYRDQWALHTALRGADFPLTQPTTAASVAALVGMSGIGKSTLAAAYAWNFGAAYADGVVCWLSLNGAGESDDAVLARYENEVRTIAELLGLRPGDSPRHEVLGRVADHLAELAGPSLWIVDDVPTGLDTATVGRLVLPGDTKVRTILTCHEDRYGSVARSVVLGPMPDPDVALLLEQFRRPADAERDGFDRLVRLLRGHPLVVQVAGNALRDRVDLVSYDDFADLLADSPDPVAAVTVLLEPVLRRLDEPARLVLRLARAGAPTGLPAGYVGLVVDRLLGPGLVADALVELKDLALATVDGSSWRIHQLVLDAARTLDSPVPQAVLLRTAAEVIGVLADDPELGSVDRGDLMRHAGALAAAPDLDGTAAVRLLHRATAYYERRGEPVLSAPLRDQLALLDPTPDAYATAAEVHLAAGEYEAAGEWAGRAVASGDPVAAYRGRRIEAEALDALGRYAQADRRWQLLDRTAPPGDPVLELRTDVARLRSLRLRGRMSAVKSTAPAIIARADALADDPTAFELGQAARLDLARAEVLTDGQREARDRAAAVLQCYEDRGLHDHARALEAQEVLAEARLTMHLWELNPDRDHWLKAEAELGQLYEGYVGTHGRTNPLTLTSGVDYAYALVSQGRRDAGRTMLATLAPAIERRLGPEHPLYYRAVFLRGLIHAQLQQAAEARPLFEQALAGQLVTLGPGHAHTLRTEYELAVALKLLGDPGWLPLMREVRDRARDAVGRENDLYAQSLIALGLLRLPTSWVRAVARFGRPTP